ncbi:putative O-glycosylation ligase, exosortase A system-associated [Thalassotalea euphylliae]|uniref:putative O-glycosylation ligase, exosortase A system-associated n=1 Tax=Thalassotalea euphylliae TaxID=1655234 RepID=UPI0036437121
MRDLILVIFLFITIYYSFKRPFLGIVAWLWIALMAPTVWAYGFSTSFRMNFTVALIAMASYLVLPKEKGFKANALLVLVLLFGFWNFWSSAFHIQIDGGAVWNYFIQVVKILLLFLFITLACTKRLHIDAIIWAIVLAISAYAAMEGVKFILSAGGHRIVGRSPIIADRNDFAVAVNMCIPLILYLWSTTKHKLLKQGLMGLCLLNVVAIIGTFSRGGFIGISILGLFLWFKSNHKLVLALLAALIIPIGFQYAPDEWKERQSTIKTAAAEDSSFIGRLWAWKISTLIAIDNPLTGGGYKAVTDRVVWFAYKDETSNFGPIYTPEVPNYIKPKAAHNIYFQVLGDQGFVGLFLFLTMLATCYFNCRTIAKKAKKNGVEWCQKLSGYITLSLVGYGITGMNVSLAYFELLYALIAIVCVLNIREMYKKEELNYEKT